MTTTPSHRSTRGTLESTSGGPVLGADVRTAAARLDPSGAWVLRSAGWAVVLLLGGATLLGALQLLKRPDALSLATSVLSNEAFWQALAIGAFAQAIDGALGMAYGLTSTSFLLASGLPPLTASASVHIAEVFTTGASGLSHLRLGNVDRRLFVRLLLPGLAGGVAGAWMLAQVDGEQLRPWIFGYLLLMGLFVILRAWRARPARSRPPRLVAPLALAGGWLDAVGGGGWGPVVTGTLVGRGHDARRVIGTVNLAEFFLTFTTAGAFALLVAQTPWSTVAGLVVGGVLVAPAAAWLTRRLPIRALLFLVGGLIVTLSVVNLWKALA